MNTLFFISRAWVNLAYLSASVLFVVGIRGLRHPRTAVRGNVLGAAGMAVAIIATLLARGLAWPVVMAGILSGGAVGLWVAHRVPMTGMPQMVAALNGFGGLASALVAGIAVATATDFGPIAATGSVASAIIGLVTFTGSFVAFAKLQGWISSRAMTFFGHHFAKTLVLAVVVASATFVVVLPQAVWPIAVLGTSAALLGVLLVIPIGGADMPVVISLLNAYSGIAAAAAGLALRNNALIVAGSLVGASGIILTQIMCRAMNRSLVQVLFGIQTGGGTALSADDVYGGRVKSTTADEVAMVLDAARRVIIVPGYGMAVAQAQHAVRGLAKELAGRGIDVQFAIHPVAGRMPGHMNVLLAEADVPYDQLRAMEDINESFEQTDVALVIGANDVVNPDARDNPQSPIAGMPVLNVDRARTVIVIKRSLSPGFANIPNPLFAADNALMLYGDGRKAIDGLVTSLREL